MKRYNEGTATSREQQIVEQWLTENEMEHNEWAQMNNAERDELVKKLGTDLLHYIKEKENPPVYRMYSFRRWGLIAASVTLILMSVLFFRIINDKKDVPASAATTIVDVGPGKDGAILTLADGKQLVLDSLDNGVVATQNGVQALLKNGRLAYNVKEHIGGKVLYNTMTTPKGRQYQVTLPDGTQVWLNAASSIHFPTVFSDKKRAVIITGEAYLEVAPDPQRPFVVTVGKTDIEVLGTHFNVMAYNNEEEIRTTLLEGSVKITDEDRTATLRPGEELQLNARQFEVIRGADVAAAVAWKNGWFVFKDAGIQTVMRQAERWYNISVKYEGRIPEKQFNGKVSRNVTLSELMEILSFYDDMKCTISGDTITIKQ
ncbi:MAG TPA: FecR domain-containing protein [Agriterribacter sp.]|nr:FecR domain-containing protein [Agriterribacter sp.]HRQ49621.1 FecR domain-containing protein [Agriterribacter sp.]